MTFGQDSSSNLYFLRRYTISGCLMVAALMVMVSFYQFSGGAEYINILSLFFHLFYKEKLLINYLVTLRYSSFGKSMIMPQNNLILSSIIQRRKLRQIIGGARL